MKLLKTLVIPFLVVSLVLGIALPTLANSKVTAPQTMASLKPDNEQRKPARVQVIKGEVTAVSDNVIKVDDKEIIVTDETKFKIPGEGKDGSLADIKVGMNIIAQTRVDNGKFYARQIVVVPGRPDIVRHSGNVTAYSYDGATSGNITILDKDGKLITFDIVGGKFRILPKGAEVKVGEWVTVIAHRQPPAGRLIATAVVVHLRPLPPITGIITNITETGSDNGTITIGTTVLKYDARTLFALRGVGLSVKVGQEATAFYREQADHSLLARRVLVGIKPPVKPRPAVAGKVRERIEAKIGDRLEKKMEKVEKQMQKKIENLEKKDVKSNGRNRGISL